jgi:arginine/lysine/ornithine decarboxylase
MYDLLMQLKDYTSDDYVPLHMPGSKRNTELFSMGNPYGIDITEIDGFDNLHNAQGILKKGMIRAARLFGAEETLYLVNGSSAGIMAAICGATKKNDTVLVARNCHISVYNAIYLNELKPIYIYPQEIIDKSGKSTGIYGKVSPQEIEKKLERNKEITAVVVTSPTYEGVVSDIEKIAQTVHRHNAVLIVDEAHGAHFPFSSAFPQTAVKCGADVVIQSIHKTLPAFTQTALLHLNGDRIDRERVKRYWNIYQTTSPSYILMAGIENCMTILENDGAKLFETYIERLRLLRENIESLKNI